MVCTGNICRSPAMHYLAQREWGDAAEVSSAGTYAEIGMDATREIRRSAAHYDVTMPRHRPTQLSRALIERADVVFVATESHARWIAHECGETPSHVFGIRQAAELTTRATPPHGDTPADRLRNAASALAAAQAEGPAPLRSLDDPWGHSQQVFDRVMAEIVADISALTLWARVR